MTKSIFVGISATRNAYDLLMQHLPDWLVEVAQFVPPDVLDMRRSEMWKVLSADPSVSEELVGLQVGSEDERLKASAELQQGHSWHSRLFGVLTGLAFCAVLRIVLGQAGVWVQQTGMPSMIRRIRRDPDASEFYVHGYARLGGPVMGVVALVGLASGPSEAILASLLEDDRVVLRFALADVGVYLG